MNNTIWHILKCPYDVGDQETYLEKWLNLGYYITAIYYYDIANGKLQKLKTKMYNVSGTGIDQIFDRLESTFTLGMFYFVEMRKDITKII